MVFRSFLVLFVTLTYRASAAETFSFSDQCDGRNCCAITLGNTEKGVRVSCQTNDRSIQPGDWIFSLNLEQAGVIWPLGKVRLQEDGQSLEVNCKEDTEVKKAFAANIAHHVDYCRCHSNTDKFSIGRFFAKCVDGSDYFVSVTLYYKNLGTATIHCGKRKNDNWINEADIVAILMAQ